MMIVWITIFEPMNVFIYTFFNQFNAFTYTNRYTDILTLTHTDIQRGFSLLYTWSLPLEESGG